MPRFRNLEAGSVRTKSGPLDLVTEADEAAERLIVAGLEKIFPGCVVVGEEAATADPSLLKALTGAELAFVVDPVDGTANFAAGLPLFGVMVAAIGQSEVIASVIHDPIGDDSALALRGEGTWWRTGTAISCFSTAFTPGTTPQAVCCTKKLAAIPRNSTGAPTIQPASTGV